MQKTLGVVPKNDEWHRNQHILIFLNEFVLLLSWATCLQWQLMGARFFILYTKSGLGNYYYNFGKHIQHHKVLLVQQSGWLIHVQTNTTGFDFSDSILEQALLDSLSMPITSLPDFPLHNRIAKKILPKILHFILVLPIYRMLYSGIPLHRCRCQHSHNFDCSVHLDCVLGLWLNYHIPGVQVGVWYGWGRKRIWARHRQGYWIQTI